LLEFHHASLRLADPRGPINKTLEQLANEVFRRFMRQISVSVKPLGSVPDHYLRLVDGEHVEEDHHLPQMVLRPRRPDCSDRSTHNCSRLAIPRAVSVWS